MMEFIDGITIDKIEKEDCQGFAKQVVKFGVATSLVHGVTHGDLHRGNILFIKDETPNAKTKYKLGIIDFGIINNIEPDIRNNLFDLLSSLFTTPADVSASKIIECGLIEPLDIIKGLPKVHIDNITQMLSNIIQTMIDKSREVNQIELYNFINDINSYLCTNTVSELGLKPCEGFVKLQLTIAMAHGITMTLCGENYIGLLDEVLNEMFHTKLLDM